MNSPIGRAERAAGGQVSSQPKVASPLQSEINQLRDALEVQSKALAEIRERLRPIFQDNVAPGGEKAEMPDAQLAEMPTQVRDCRRTVKLNTDLVDWLLQRIEV